MSKIFKITIIGFIALIILFLACSKKGTKPKPPKYKWTILGYFDGNNLQDQTHDSHSYVIKDLQELEGIDSTEQVQVLVMLGSSKTLGNCKYYHVQRYLDDPPDSISSEVLVDLGKKDISDPATMRNFLSFGVQKYPAEHYMLIINDHGGGWKGVCSDAINGDGDLMTLSELSSALYGFKFDIIWFYAPSMSTAEVAYQVKDRAEYMIASQFKWYPDNIMGATKPNSSAWLPYLTDNPDLGVWVFARKVTEAIYDAAMNISSSKHVNSVLIDLSKITVLATDISNLGRSLIDSTGAYWGEVWNAWSVSYSHTSMECDSVFGDLRGFARQIQNEPDLNSVIRANAEAVEASINEAIEVMFTSPPYSEHGGIAIHFPWNKDLFDSTHYAQLDFSQTNWDDFISIFIQSLWSGALEITSNPTGASIFLNGKDTGYKTNAIISGLFPGEYNVKLVRDDTLGCYFGSVLVTPQDTTILNCDLH